jgi:enoyl-CoA hydratase
MSDIETSARSMPGRVLSSRSDGVGWIVLDNPGKRNAISLAMWRSLTTALADFAADAAVRCVVIRGQGEAAFCAGADVGEKQGLGAEQAQQDTEFALACMRTIREFHKPVLAMITGYCIGAGVAIALSCDIRLAGSGASFGIPAARLGLAYHYHEIKRLTDLVGAARAKQALFTADRMSAERALAIGLIDELVPQAELLSFVTAMVGRIAANAPLTIAAAKHAVDTAASDLPVRDIAGCEAMAWACLDSEDYAEGRRAFRDKRPPVFRGR